MADNGWVLVDDRDPGIAYSGPPGATIWHGGVAQEYCVTTTGLDSGDTLTYYFNASSIAVYGTYGPTGESGPPIAIYQVDDTPATTATAPITQTTMYRQNFWTSDPQLPSLAPGAFHTLVVTVTSSNNTLWVDYLAYLPSSSAATTSYAATATPRATVAPTSTVTPISTSISTPASIFTSILTFTPSLTTSSITTQTTNVGNQTSSPAATSNKKANIGATVAGVVVGTLAFILATVALVIYIRRRRSRATVRECSMQGEIDGSPNMSQNHHTSLVPLRLPSEDTPSYPTISESDGCRDEPPRPLPSIPTRTLDGGISLMGGPLEIPPEYQEHY